MQYLEVVENVIPYIIDHILFGVEDKIYSGLMGPSSATIALDLAFDVMYQKCFDPYFQNQKDTEDSEAKSTQKERFRAYDIKDIPPFEIKKTPKVELPHPHKFMMPTQLWDDYEPSLVRQKTIEYIEEYPNERRIMEQKCIEKQNKEQMKRERSREKRQMKEQYARRIMQIGSKEYTYDYNCDPIAKNSNSVKKEVITAPQFEVPQTDNNTVISKPKLVEQIKQKRRQAENEDVIMEFVESLQQDIKLQPGVRMSLAPIQQQTTIQKQMSQQSKQLEVASISQRVEKRKTKNMVKLNDLHLVGYLQSFDVDYSLDTIMQNTNKTQIVTPTNRSLLDQQTLKQDVLRLPKLRSHSINARTKRQSRQLNAHSLLTYRE